MAALNTLYNVCAVPVGCSVPWGVFSTVGDVMIHVGDIMIHVGDIIIHMRDIMSTVGGVQYRGVLK